MRRIIAQDRHERGNVEEFRPDDATSPEELKKALVSWLTDLPKPAAVMAARDVSEPRLKATG